MKIQITSLLIFFVFNTSCVQQELVAETPSSYVTGFTVDWTTYNVGTTRWLVLGTVNSIFTDEFQDGNLLMSLYANLKLGTYKFTDGFFGDY